MRIRSAGALALARGAAGLMAWPATAAGTAIVAHPGAISTGYTTPVMVVQAGGELTFVNGDIAQHDVVADEYGPDTSDWCGPLDPDRPEDPNTNPRMFQLGRCPLFWSPLVPLGATTPVYGMENLAAGQSYEFFCSIHANMRGTIVAS